MRWIAIDPAALVDALEDQRSEIFIEWVLDSAASLTVIADKNGELFEEYIQFLEEQLDQGHDGTIKPSPALELVNSLISDDGTIRLFDKVNPWREAEWQQISGRRKCIEHVEQLLIGLAHDAYKNWGRQLVILLMIEKKLGAKQRGLWDTHRQEQYLKEIGLLVQTPQDVKPSLPRVFEMSTRQGYWFEDKMRLILQRIYPKYIFRVNTPATVKDSYRIGQVDVWASCRSEESHSVLLGECKLREHNDDYIEDFVIHNQLRKKIDAVLDFEYRQQVDTKQPMELKLFVASNAPGMTDSAWNAAAKLTADYKTVSASFLFLQVELTEGWEQQEEWGIASVTEWQLDTAGESLSATLLRKTDCTDM